MTDRPILFSAPMVQALLAGRKTQTRRLINPQPMDDGYFDGEMHCDEVPAMAQYPKMFRFSATAVGGGAIREASYEPRHNEGDRLYVREAWRADIAYDAIPPRDLQTNVAVLYEAGGESRGAGHQGKFRQGMHMPRWASRLTLTVTEVRVQRLQDITEEDAIAEGIEQVNYPGVNPLFFSEFGWKAYDKLPDGAEHPHNAAPYDKAKRSFQSLWDSINADRCGWDQNPWVTATSFSVAKVNIDRPALITHTHTNIQGASR